MNALKTSMYGLQYEYDDDDDFSIERHIIRGLVTTSFGFMFSTSWAEGEPFGMVLRDGVYREENNED